MASQNAKFWKYAVKKSFIMGNQSKYYQQYFCIDEVATEITCASSTKQKDVTDRFAFADINQVFDSAVPEEDCPAPTAYGFSISNGGSKVWNIYCDDVRVRDDWVLKLNNVLSKMQKIRQLSRGSSSNTALLASLSAEAVAFPDCRLSRGSNSFRGDGEESAHVIKESHKSTDAISAEVTTKPTVPRRRKSSITFNFDEIDGKKGVDVGIAGANPMKDRTKHRHSDAGYFFK